VTNMQRAYAARDKARELLGDLPGINGVGITWDDAGEPCVRVNVERSISDENRRRIPKAIDDVPVLVEIIGPIRMEG